MADSTTTTVAEAPPTEAAPSAAEPAVSDRPPRRPRGPPLHQIYSLPAPIRTFPLPSFYHNNPVSLFHLVYTWTKQLLSPPPTEPSVIHTGAWDPATRSVHITDHAAVRALWEQGFYGKGNLSRSEPNWLKREQIRRGAAGDVSEQWTAKRREERRQAKWERARTEQEALERTRLEEAGLQVGVSPDSTVPATLPADLAARVNPKTEASRSEGLGTTQGYVIALRVPVETTVEPLLDVTETVIEEPVAPSPEAEEERPVSLDGAAKEPFTLESQPAQQEEIPASPVPAVDVTPTAPVEVPAPSIPEGPPILEAPLLWKAPVGPLELLALPNCAAAVRVPSTSLPKPETELAREPHTILKAPVGPLELLALPNSAIDLQPRLSSAVLAENILAASSSTTDDGENTQTHSIASQPVPEPISRSRSPVRPLELLALPNSLTVKETSTVQAHGLNGVAVNGFTRAVELIAPGRGMTGAAVSKSPVGPLELLALPNSLAVLQYDLHGPGPTKSQSVTETEHTLETPQDEATWEASRETSYGAGWVSDDRVSVDGASELRIESDEDEAEIVEDDAETNGTAHLNGHTKGPIFGDIPLSPVIAELAGSKRAVTPPDVAVEQPPKRRRKSVRFSDTVEATTFTHSDPPSPPRSTVAKSNGAPTELVSAPREAATVMEEASAPEDKEADKTPATSSETSPVPNPVADIENKEHLQLSTEEAFFLSYGIGALSILDPDTKQPIPRDQLLQTFRSHSYFPPSQELSPNDPFLIHYAVYHHFRSLGWVPRHGVKFGVDWMLYTRGPVFDHAEFGLMVMPAYSDPWWKENGVEAPRKSWHWLHGVNRVLSHVLKSLVLVYVDVPSPLVFDSAMAAGGISAALKEYKVREFMVRRWSSNRNR